MTCLRGVWEAPPTSCDLAGRHSIRASSSSSPTLTDCDATLEVAEKLGAVITSLRIDVPGIGRFTTLLDPQHAPIAVMGPIT